MVHNNPGKGCEWGGGYIAFLEPPGSDLLLRTHITSSVPQVEAVIHPRFLADLLSPEQQRDPLALIEELEQEEGLSFSQVSLEAENRDKKLA